MTKTNSKPEPKFRLRFKVGDIVHVSNMEDPEYGKQVTIFELLQNSDSNSQKMYLNKGFSYYVKHIDGTLDVFRDQDLTLTLSAPARLIKGSGTPDGYYLNQSGTITLNGKLRDLRRAKGYNAREFATKAGISYSYLSDIELGRTLPSLTTVARICKTLEIGLPEFFQNVSISTIDGTNDSGVIDKTDNTKTNS